MQPRAGTDRAGSGRGRSWGRSQGKQEGAAGHPSLTCVQEGTPTPVVLPRCPQLRQMAATFQTNRADRRSLLLLTKCSLRVQARGRMTPKEEGALGGE